jgi:hypothetical protein
VTGAPWLYLSQHCLQRPGGCRRGQQPLPILAHSPPGYPLLATCRSIDGMKKYLHALKNAYPDFWVEIDQIGTCDVNSIFVTYGGSATNLGEYHSHKPTRHTSNFQGCNLIKFNDDRSKITEIMGE